MAMEIVEAELESRQPEHNQLAWKLYLNPCSLPSAHEDKS